MADKDALGDSEGDSSVSDMPPSLAYRPFPPLMKLYYQWSLAGLTTFYVCGADQQDRLFAVKLHTGYSMKEPLGPKQGLHLYNGPTTNDPLLAAAGDDSMVRALPLNNNSRVFLPARRRRGLSQEMMRAYITADKHVAFSFSLEIGYGKKRRREVFEWRNIEKSERDESTEHGGFRLFRLPPNPEQDAPGGGSSSQGASTSSAAASTDDVVAVMAWRRFLTSPKHPFDLKIVGDGLGGSLGDRWTLMALITALRLWELHQRGKTQKAPVAVADKVGPKEKTAK
ncbi:hypothetical protein F4803DRAFT_529111 [Xylaria telfairii]|nr:hypothetical protein F4803DRAFT_529111 [Xylaria telfairii]